MDGSPAQSLRLRLRVTANSDPNTFDRTLVTVRSGADVFTFKVDDLANGPLWLPHLGVAVLPDRDQRDYAAVAEAQTKQGTKTLYDRVAEMPEQTWPSAWEGDSAQEIEHLLPDGAGWRPATISAQCQWFPGMAIE